MTLDLDYWQMTHASLMATVEEAVSDCAELDADDPTLPTEVAKYVQARTTLNAHIAELVAFAALREDA